MAKKAKRANPKESSCYRALKSASLNHEIQELRVVEHHVEDLAKVALAGAVLPAAWKLIWSARR